MSSFTKTEETIINLLYNKELNPNISGITSKEELLNELEISVEELLASLEILLTKGFIEKTEKEDGSFTVQLSKS